MHLYASQIRCTNACYRRYDDFPRFSLAGIHNQPDADGRIGILCCCAFGKGRRHIHRVHCSIRVHMVSVLCVCVSAQESWQRSLATERGHHTYMQKHSSITITL